MKANTQEAGKSVETRRVLGKLSCGRARWSALALVLLLVLSSMARAGRPVARTAKCDIRAQVRTITEWASDEPLRLRLSPGGTEAGLSGSASVALLTNVDATVRVSRRRAGGGGTEGSNSSDMGLELDYDGDGASATGAATGGRVGNDASWRSLSHPLSHVPGDGNVVVRLSVRVPARAHGLPDASYSTRLKLVAAPRGTLGGRPSELTVYVTGPDGEIPVDVVQSRARSNDVVAWAGPVGMGGKSVGCLHEPVDRPVLVESRTPGQFYREFAGLAGPWFDGPRATLLWGPYDGPDGSVLTVARR